MLRLFRRLSLPYLRASVWRTALVIGGIATGVALIAAIAIINASILDNLRRTVDLVAGPAALQVTAEFGELGLDESAAATVRADPGVAVAVPLARGAIALADEPTAPLQLFGVDLTAEEDLARYGVTTADRPSVLRSLADPHALLLTAAFAASRGLAVGRTVRVSTPTGIRDLTVRGLLDTAGIARTLDGRLAVMDLPAAQALLRKDGSVDQIDVILQPNADADAAQRRLQASLGSSFAVLRPEQRGAQLEHMVAAFQAMLSGLSALCLVAGTFLVYNTTATAAVRRANVMSALRLIGAESATLFRVLVAEAVVSGLCGALLGLAAGIALAHALVDLVSVSMGVIFQLEFPVEHLRLSVFHQAGIVGLGVATAALAAAFPARRAARSEPLRLLREAPTGRTRSTKLLVGAWLAMLAVAALGLMLQTVRHSFLWGNFGSTVWNASVVIIAVPIVGWTAALARTRLPHRLGLVGRFAVESLDRSRTRAGVTVAAVALVIAVGITVSTLAASFRHSVLSYMTADGFLLGDLVVSSTTTLGGWLEAPLPTEVGDVLRAVPGVRAAEGWRVLFGQRFRGERIAFFAADDAYLDPSRIRQRWYRDGDAAAAAPALRGGRGVLVSDGLAERFGLGLGAVVELETPTGVAALPIVGVARDYLSDRGTVIMSRTLLRERWHETGVSRFHVYVDAGVDPAVVRERIAAALRDRHVVKVLSLAEVAAYQGAAIDRAFAFTDAIQLLIVIVAVVGVFDLLLASITERRRELAVWRLIGADDATVGRSITLESTTMGVLAVVLGSVVGIVTGAIWVYLNFPWLLGFRLEYVVPWHSIAWYAVLALAMTTVAGRLAAREGTRTAIVEHLRPE